MYKLRDIRSTTQLTKEINANNGSLEMLELSDDYGNFAVMVSAIRTVEKNDVPQSSASNLLFKNKVSESNNWSKGKKLISDYILKDSLENTIPYMEREYKRHVLQGNPGGIFKTVTLVNNCMPPTLAQGICVKLIDKSFFSDYEEFCRTNTKRYYNAKENGKLVEHKLSFLLSGESLGIFDWCYANLCSNKRLFRRLLHITMLREKYKKWQKLLGDKAITSYYGLDGLDSVIEKLNKLKNEVRSRRGMNLFNTTQRHILINAYDGGSEELKERMRRVLVKFGLLSDEKKKNIIRKLSTIDNFDGLMSNLSGIIGIQFNWSKKSVMSVIDSDPSLKCDIVYDSGNLMAIRVYDYHTIYVLGKNTSWCITKSSEHWSSYMEEIPNNKQYLIFDFSKPENHPMSIVGITITLDNAIYASHNYNNDDIMYKVWIKSDDFWHIPTFSYQIDDLLANDELCSRLFKRNIFGCANTPKRILSYVDNITNGDFTHKFENNKLVIFSKNRDLMDKIHERFTENVTIDMFNVENPFYRKSEYKESLLFMFDFNEGVRSVDRACYGIQTCDSANSLLKFRFYDGFIREIKYKDVIDVEKRFGFKTSDFLTIPNEKQTNILRRIDYVDDTVAKYIVENGLIDDTVLSLRNNSYNKSMFQRSISDSMWRLNSFSFIKSFYDAKMPLSMFVGPDLVLETISDFALGCLNDGHKIFMKKEYNRRELFKEAKSLIGKGIEDMSKEVRFRMQFFYRLECVFYMLEKEGMTFKQVMDGIGNFYYEQLSKDIYSEFFRNSKLSFNEPIKSLLF